VRLRLCAFHCHCLAHRPGDLELFLNVRNFELCRASRNDHRFDYSRFSHLALRFMAGSHSTTAGRYGEAAG
jgi:hypothetical protein